MTESTAHSEAEIRESVREFQSLIVLGGGETGLVYISPSHWDLECQGVMISGTPDRGNKAICGLTGCTLQTFVKPYEPTIFPSLFSMDGRTAPRSAAMDTFR